MASLAYGHLNVGYYMPPSAKLSSYVPHYENLFCERVFRERDYALEGSLSVAITRTQFIVDPLHFSAAGTLTVLEIEPWPPCAGYAKSRGERANGISRQCVIRQDLSFSLSLSHRYFSSSVRSRERSLGSSPSHRGAYLVKKSSL